MLEQYATEKKRESIFLNEHFMAAACAVVVVTGLASLYFCFAENDSFAVFELLTKLVTAASMYLAFRFFKWDVAKGLKLHAAVMMKLQDRALSEIIPKPLDSLGEALVCYILGMLLIRELPKVSYLRKFMPEGVAAPARNAGTI